MRLQLQKRYKHFRRYREIANVLVKHGFGFLLNSLGLAEFSPPRRLSAEEKNAPEETIAIRMRMVLEELGPTFIKLGQLLSTRSDIFTAAYIKELEKLQDKVPPVPFADISELLELELGQTQSQIFSHFNPMPLAAASIGQVHEARLINGRRVAVKVQRPGIRANVEVDMEILYDLAGLAERHTVWGKIYKFTEMVEEFEHILQEELDFMLEARHAETLARNFAGEQYIVIPAIYWDYTTKRVLTMEFINGIKITDNSKLAAAGYDMTEIARRLVETMLKQILMDGFFHADPHPGNVLALPGGRLAFLDFGMMGYLEQELRDKVIKLVFGLINKNSTEILRAVMSLEALPVHVNMYQLRRDIEHLREKYYQIPLGQVSAAESLGDIMNLAYRHRIRVPIELNMMIKALIITEGIAARLDPRISIVQVIEPLGQKLLRRRFSPESIRKLFWDNINDYHILFTRLPGQLGRIIELLTGGEIKVKTENPDLGRALIKLNTMVNRLVYSIIVGAMVISSSWLIRERITFWGVPLAEMGFVFAGLLGFWLLAMIIRSKFY
ncbi:AarF/UbiB family protein [Desulfoscipio sp. XC116]|uniref:ABC1 kinase family protein n=1 Tax=Desulfoscipio sp. XC116 TaxID=3144975 RepID=UPI00325AAD4C